jgi:hypothetical protein
VELVTARVGGRLADGRTFTFHTCPSAEICAQACYARHGTDTWPVVRANTRRT